MMARKISLTGLVFSLVIASVFLFGAAGAQTPFALTNLGQRVDPQDARMVGRGGWGMAVSDSLHPGFKNVAGLSDVRHVVVKFTGYGDHVKSQEGIGERVTHRTVSPDIRLALPLIKGKLAFSAGFEVTRSNQFQTLVPGTWYAWGDTLRGNQYFSREGSLWSVPLGLSWEVLPGLSLGGTLGLVNGTIREEVKNLFITPANFVGYPLYLANGRVQDDQFDGTALTWSVLVSPFDRLKIGASWCQAYDISVDRKVEVAGVGNRYYDVLNYGMPDEYKAGLDLQVTGRWHVGGDFQMMNFKEFTGRDDWMPAMEEEITYSFGLERSQDYERHKGLSNLPLRLGYQYRQWGYQVGGSPVVEKFFSAGTGFPFNQKMGQLDLAFSYGTIGDLEDNSYRSKVWRFTMSFTGLESWW